MRVGDKKYIYIYICPVELVVEKMFVFDFMCS